MTKRTRILAGLTGSAALVGAALAGLLGTTAASATTAVAKFITVSAEHADTTSVSGTATQAGPGGPIWADDHLKETITVSSAGAANHYNVTISFGGSTFSGFADPRATGEAGSDGSTAGGPMFSQGKVTGSITYDDITATQAPTAPPATEPPNTSLNTTLDQVLGSHDAVTTHYTLHYTPSMNSVDPTGGSTSNVWTAGTVYTQTG